MPFKPERRSLQHEEALNEAIHKDMHYWKLLQAYYRGAMLEVKTKFDVLNEEFNVDHDRNPIESIKTRIKEPRSIAAKLARMGLPLSIKSLEDNIFDIAGVRIICSFMDDIYTLADCLSGQNDIRLIECKDYIAHPKPSGYRSLHLIVEVPIFLKAETRHTKVEVQLRTIAMDFWASLEHKIRYKKTTLQEPALEEIGQHLSRISQKAASLDADMQKVRDAIAQLEKELESDGFCS